jgi:hypothetical protein
MQKGLAIALLLIITLPANGSKEAAQSKPNEKAAQNYPPPSQVGQVQHDTAERESDRPKDAPEGLIARHVPPEKVTNFGLFVVGVFGVFAAFFTLLAIKKQTDIQSASLRQWIEVGQWRGEVLKGFHDEDRYYLKVIVQIVNRTNAPLTLKEGRISFDNYTRFETGQDTFLAPDAPYLIAVDFGITEEQAHAFKIGGPGIVIPVSGSFVHVGTLKRRVEQTFDGLLTLGQNWHTFDYHVHANPKEKKGKPAD